MIKVMLIDDEPEIRRLLERMVEKQPDYQVVSQSGDFSGAVVDFTKYRPDVVFMDIDLKGESGLECARVLTELNPDLKVIFATARCAAVEICDGSLRVRLSGETLQHGTGGEDPGPHQKQCESGRRAGEPPGQSEQTAAL